MTQLPMPIALLFLFTDNPILKELLVVTTTTNLSINLSPQPILIRLYPLHHSTERETHEGH